MFSDSSSACSLLQHACTISHSRDTASWPRRPHRCKLADILCKELRAGRLCDELLEWVGRQEHNIRIRDPHGAILLLRKVRQLLLLFMYDCSLSSSIS